MCTLFIITVLMAFVIMGLSINIIIRRQNIVRANGPVHYIPLKYMGTSPTKFRIKKKRANRKDISVEKPSTEKEEAVDVVSEETV